MCARVYDLITPLSMHASIICHVNFMAASGLSLILFSWTEVECVVAF